jgi:hypothetical protein
MELEEFTDVFVSAVILQQGGQTLKMISLKNPAA